MMKTEAGMKGGLSFVVEGDDQPGSIGGFRVVSCYISPIRGKTG